MKPIKSRFVLLGVFLFLVIGLVVLIVTAPVHPVALLRVVDAKGKPVAGATILPEDCAPRMVRTGAGGTVGEPDQTW